LSDVQFRSPGPRSSGSDLKRAYPGANDGLAAAVGQRVKDVQELVAQT
jgi:hypothetical protein